MKRFPSIALGFHIGFWSGVCLIKSSYVKDATSSAVLYILLMIISAILGYLVCRENNQ
jgi:hypothetical protein